MAFLGQFWSVTTELAPWLFLGAMLAGALHAFVPDGFVSKHLGRKSVWGVVKAVLLGVPLPLCSCAVIPAGIGLRKEGASEGASVGFLISTPQTGVDSISVSAAVLGWPFALFKVISALITGILGGLITNVVCPDGGEDEAPLKGVADEGCCGGDVSGRMASIISFAFGDLLRGIWVWVLLGMTVSAAISTFVAPGAIADKAWASGLAGMLVMLLVSVPLYICATGSVPVAAALVSAGLSPGSAIVFLMAGPATNVATLGAVLKTFGRRVAAVYLGTIVVGSIGFGLLFDRVLPETVISHIGHHTENTSWLQHACGGLLLALFAYYAWTALASRRLAATVAREKEKAGSGTTLRIRVGGLTCGNCAKKLQSALLRMPGVIGAAVDHAEGIAEVSGSGLCHDALHGAVENAGFVVVSEPTPV